MSIPKKELMSNKATTKSASAKPQKTGSLKASALTAHTLRSKAIRYSFKNLPKTGL